ncbi:MAG: DUF4176 domain-containing protein [Hespellia sp.]|nr:DUF4176 domain-containing protein [Hespellia sp.]
MEENKMLPLGTIVILQGGVKKVMIIARGIGAENKGEMQYFEYGGCLYPEGLMGEQILYFNQDNISEIISEGYSDEDDLRMVENLNDWIKTSHLKKGNASEWNTKE